METYSCNTLPVYLVGLLFVIDEVRKIPDWSTVVKSLFDQDRASHNLKIVLLGSVSLGLQRGLAESLAGRYEVIPAHHWNLDECRRAFGWDVEVFSNLAAIRLQPSLPATWNGGKATSKISLLNLC